MLGNQPDEGLGGELLIFAERQVFQRRFRPGRLLVAAGGTEGAKGGLGQFAGIFAVAVATKDDHQLFAVDAGNNHPVKALDPVEEISDDHQDIGGADLAEMDIGPAIAGLDLIKGGAKIAQFRSTQFGQFELTHQIEVGDIEQVAEADAVGHLHVLFLEVLGVDLDAVKQGRGQGNRGFDSGGPQIFDHHRRDRTVFGTDIDEGGIPAGGHRMVIDDRVKGHFFKTNQMVRLGVDQDLLGVLLHRQGVESFDGDLEALHHGHVVEPADLVGVADGDAVDPIAEQPLERHGRGNGIGIGADDDQDGIAALEYGPEAVESG